MMHQHGIRDVQQYIMLNNITTTNDDNNDNDVPTVKTVNKSRIRPEPIIRLFLLLFFVISVGCVISGTTDCSLPGVCWFVLHLRMDVANYRSCISSAYKVFDKMLTL